MSIKYKEFPKQHSFYNEINGKYNLSHGLYSEDLYTLLTCAEQLKSGSNYVEIGVADGSSILAVSLFRPDINCYGVEINPTTKAEQVIKDMNIKNINLLLGRGAEDVCKEWNREIDLLFIDGEHYVFNIVWDILGWMPYVKKNGPILFHDYEGKEGPKFEVGRVLEVIRNHPKYNLYIPSIDDNISTSMAVLTKNE